jgi:hypothetical protein
MRKLIVAVVVVALLLIAADRVAAFVVQDRLAAAVDAQEGVDGATVDIKGFPFLTQVLRNHFDEATVTLPTLETGTSSGSIRVQQVRVTLKDIETSRGYTQVAARSVTGSGLIPYSEFDQFGVTVEYGGEATNGSGYLEVSLPSLSGQSLRVVPSVATGLTLDLGVLRGVAGVLPPAVRQLVQHPYDLAGVPAGITIKSIAATEDGLEVTLAGTKVKIAR